MRRTALLAALGAAAAAVALTIPASAGTVATGEPAGCQPTDPESLDHRADRQ
jgi:hypothetical protein